MCICFTGYIQRRYLFFAVYLQFSSSYENFHQALKKLFFPGINLILTSVLVSFSSERMFRIASLNFIALSKKEQMPLQKIVEE